MYCVAESIVTTMPPEKLQARQLLFEELLPDWESRIKKVAAMTFPKVDQRLMALEDIQQEISSAIWEAVLAYDPDRGMSIKSWVFNIINQAAGLIAKLQYHNMPHNGEGHGMQLLPLVDESLGSENESESYEVYTQDPDSVGRIESEPEKQECIDFIRPALKVGFEQAVFDLFMKGYTGGDIVQELGLNPKRGGAARVSSVKLKIKIAYAIVHGIALEEVSKAKNTGDLAKQIRRNLYSNGTEDAETEELPPPNICPQFA